MLTVNVDVSDGLVNGARGIIASASKTAKRVVVMLVDVSIGLEAIQRRPYKTIPKSSSHISVCS